MLVARRLAGAENPLRQTISYLGYTTLAASDSAFSPKVMVVTTFEVGADTGDRPGEFQFWVERENLTNTVTVAGMDHIVRWRSDGLFGCVSGTTVRCAEQILVLGLDRRFDFSHTYWLLNGIAGVNPAVASVGSAAWARWVVDGDLAYEIDSREIPASWPYGLIPLGGRVPNDRPGQAKWAPDVMAWQMNPALVQWAFERTRDLVIPDSPEAEAHRKKFTSWPAAQAPARVFIGDSLGSGRYWHGERQNQWASEWVRLQTGGRGEFAMTNMEDHGLASALSRLTSMGRVDFKRVMVLRTGSNFSVPAPDQTAVESLTAEYQGMRPALESAYRAGSTVVHELLAHWSQYQGSPPQTAVP